MKKFIFASLLAAAGAVSAPASAAPIFGSFSLSSFGGSYVGGTAATATGLDFDSAFGGTGNGYGTNGTAQVGNAQGSFSGLNGTIASISDIALGATANPFASNPFISFGNASNIVFNFNNASFTRSVLGTSVTLTGTGVFSNGTAADTTAGMFTLATSSQNGMSSDFNFTFTSNLSSAAAAVPEPATWAMMLVGIGMMGFAMRRRKKNVTTTVSYAA